MQNIAVTLLTCTAIVNAIPSKYLTQRAKILVEEQSASLGGQLHLWPSEQTANDILMTAKRAELDAGFRDSSKFLPAKNFLVALNDIRKSEIFQIIEKMPKGAILHTHDTAIVSDDFVYNNITFRDNLYICDVDGTLKFHFFEVANEDCDWKLLSELRRNETAADDLNSRIRRSLSMVVPDPETAYPDVDAAWMAFMNIFIAITPMLTYRPVYEDHFYQGLQEFYDDNVMYLELRTTLPTLYELNGTEYGPLDVVRIYKEVNDRFIKDHPDFLGTKLIYSPLRSVTQEEFDNHLSVLSTVSREFPHFVAGFDLVGQEDKGEPLFSFVEQLHDLTDDIKLFFHAGETNWYGHSTDENLIDAVLLNATRIGHGFALLKHPKVLEMARSLDIALEVNPISNQVLELVDDLRNHPANMLFAVDYPVVISNDDPGLWGAKGLSYDFYEAFMGMMSRESDLRALKQLAINSLKYSVMDDSEKERAFAIWRRKWDEFITELIVSSSQQSSRLHHANEETQLWFLRATVTQEHDDRCVIFVEQKFDSETCPME